MGGALSPLLLICFLNDIPCDFETFHRNAFGGSDYPVANLGAFAGDLAIFVIGDDFLHIESDAQRCTDFVCDAVNREFFKLAPETCELMLFPCDHVDLKGMRERGLDLHVNGEKLTSGGNLNC